MWKNWLEPSLLNDAISHQSSTAITLNYKRILSFSNLSCTCADCLTSRSKSTKDRWIACLLQTTFLSSEKLLQFCFGTLKVFRLSGSTAHVTLDFLESSEVRFQWQPLELSNEAKWIVSESPRRSTKDSRVRLNPASTDGLMQLILYQQVTESMRKNRLRVWDHTVILWMIQEKHSCVFICLQWEMYWLIQWWLKTLRRCYPFFGTLRRSASI